MNTLLRAIGSMPLLLAHAALSHNTLEAASEDTNTGNKSNKPPATLKGYFEHLRRITRPEQSALNEV